MVKRGDDRVTPPTQAQTNVPPPGHLERHVLDTSVAMEMLLELQRSVGAIDKTLGKVETRLEGVEKSIDGVKGDVKALMTWKAAILGGAIAVGALLSFIGILVYRYADRVSITPPVQVTQPIQQPAVYQPQPAQIQPSQLVQPPQASVPAVEHR